MRVVLRSRTNGALAACLLAACAAQPSRAPELQHVQALTPAQAEAGESFELDISGSDERSKAADLRYTTLDELLPAKPGVDASDRTPSARRISSDLSIPVEGRLVLGIADGRQAASLAWWPSPLSRGGKRLKAEGGIGVLRWSVKPGPYRLDVTCRRDRTELQVELTRDGELCSSSRLPLPRRMRPSDASWESLSKHGLRFHEGWGVLNGPSPEIAWTWSWSDERDIYESVLSRRVDRTWTGSAGSPDSAAYRAAQENASHWAEPAFVCTLAFEALEPAAESRTDR